MADDVVNPLGVPTTNYGWTKPTVGADDDVWGGMLNTNFDGIDTTVKAVSNVANAAQTSTQVDAKIAAAAYVLPIATTSLLGGVKPDGTTITIDGTGKISGGSSYTLPTASTTVLGGVKVDGTTVTIASGVISAAGGSAVSVSATAPSSPTAGQLWYDTVGGQMYVWYNDGTSSQWVPVVNQGYTPTAPLLVKPPAVANWTARNSASGSDVANGVLITDTAGSATPSDSLRGLTLASPSTPYTIDMNLSAFTPFNTAVNLTSGAIGAGWTDGTKYQTISIVARENAGVAGQGYVPELLIVGWSSATLAAVVISGTRFNIPLSVDNLWLRFADNGTNVTFSMSADGINYSQIYTVAKSGGYLGSSGYSNIGFFADALASGQTNMSHLVTLRSWWVH